MSLVSLPINHVIQGDCIDVMNTFPDKGINLVLTDPPYGIGLEYDIYNDTEENWEKMFLSLIPQLKRISKMSILPCCQIRKMKFIYDNYPPDWIMCWYKGSPGHRAYVGFNDWEPLLVYGKNDGVVMHDYFQCQNNEKMGNYGHPCPKPLEWAEWIISRATKEGDVVLDPFLGSGTVAVACHRLNRKWIGIEMSPTYCNIARQRIAREKQNVRLDTLLI